MPNLQYIIFSGWTTLFSLILKIWMGKITDIIVCEYSITGSPDSTVTHVSKIKYLGYAFYRYKGKYRFRVHPKSVRKMKDRIRELRTGRIYSKCDDIGIRKLKGKHTEGADATNCVLFLRTVSSETIKFLWINSYLQIVINQVKSLITGINNWKNEDILSHLIEKIDRDTI